jgi:acyl-CoA synthetase (NDP forming)
VEGELAVDLPEAQKTAARLRYPVVIKAASEDVLHKSDFGAIAVNIGNDLELESSYQRILENVKKHAPNAVIEGVLVEKMAPKGLEVIIGMKRDPGLDR